MLDALFPYQSTDQRTVLAAARAVQAAGARRLWLTHSLGLDAHLLVAALAARLPRLELGIAVSLMPMRHPLQAAVETRTLAALTGGRFSLGLGVSEPATVERTLGLRWAPGPAYAREYLTVVRELVVLTVVRELVVRRRVDFRGAHLHVDAELPAMTAPPAPLLLGALGPRMAHVAGEVADGCICWLATPERVERVIVPAVRAGADQSGRAAPEVVALVPALVTDDPVDALRLAEHAFGPHIRRPHYRRALAADGLPTAPAGGVSPALRDALLAWGDPDAVATRVRRYMDAGATRVAVAAYAWGSKPRETFAATVRAAAGAMLEVAA